MTTAFNIIKRCRVCGSGNLEDILFLGNQPLANALHKNDKPQEKYPLTFCLCMDCNLAQIKETILKEILFDSYVWVSGTSQLIKQYASLFCERVTVRTGLGKGDLVVEIASNDGTILKPFKEKGYRVLGVDPARNIAEIAQSNGIPTLPEYWNKPTASRIKEQFGNPKVLIARNVIPHVSELNEVMEAMGDTLGNDSIGIIEYHNAGIILEQLHYDSIYHEHLCYFTLQTMTKLLNRHHLYPFHIEQSPISGGSSVVYFAKESRSMTGSYLAAVLYEKRHEVNTIKRWQRFSERSREHGNILKKMVKGIGLKTVVAFGASARSSTLLNFCEFTNKNIHAVIDNNQLKQGLYTPGSNIPIISFEDGRKMNPDLIFILAWNFKDEIMARCRQSCFQGDYLIPFPNRPCLVEGELIRKIKELDLDEVY